MSKFQKVIHEEFNTALMSENQNHKERLLSAYRSIHCENRLLFESDLLKTSEIYERETLTNLYVKEHPKEFICSVAFKLFSICLANKK